MVAPSKLFVPPLSAYHCSQSILHPGRTCVEYFLANCYKNSLSSLKYFLPLVITPTVLNVKHFKRDVFLGNLKYYLETSIYPALTGAFSFFLVCLMRFIFGRFTRYTTVFMPVYISAQLAWLFPKRTIRLFSIGTTQAAFEALLRQHKNFISRLVLNSKHVQTFLFMLSSAIILHHKRVKEYTGFWFVQPIPKLDNSTLCTHAESTCQEFIVNGIRFYLFYGLPLDLLSVITKRKTPRNLHEVIHRFKGLRFHMTGFFLSYVGIYRLTSCFLAKYALKSSETSRHLFSAFLSGISYIFLGKVTFCTLAIIVAVQILWQKFCKSQEHKKDGNSFLSALIKIPFSKLIIPLNMAYLSHAIIFENHTVNSLGKGFINGLTNKTTQRIHDILINNDMGELMRKASSKPVKGLF